MVRSSGDGEGGMGPLQKGHREPSSSAFALATKGERPLDERKLFHCASSSASTCTSASECVEESSLWSDSSEELLEEEEDDDDEAEELALRRASSLLSCSSLLSSVMCAAGLDGEEEGLTLVRTKAPLGVGGLACLFAEDLAFLLLLASGCNSGSGEELESGVLLEVGAASLVDVLL